jgi:hypothetical protein
MKAVIASTLIALAPALALAQTGTAAKSPAAKNAAAHKNPAAKQAKAAKPAVQHKTVVAKAHAGTTAKAKPGTAAAAAAAALAAAAASDAPLTEQELQVAQQVYTGRIACELGAFVNVQADAGAPGRFYVEGKGFKYHMRPVATSTGAVRLEDQRAGAVWLQIANKSMLMNQKLGQRMADECMGPEQQAVAQSMKTNPPKSLLADVGK